MAKVQIKITVDVPTVPNYLKTEDGKSVPLWSLTDDSLRQLGAEWTAALLKRAKEQREEDR